MQQALAAHKRFAHWLNKQPRAAKLAEAAQAMKALKKDIALKNAS